SGKGLLRNLLEIAQLFTFFFAEPPSFVRKLENLSSLAGSEVSLICSLKGSEFSGTKPLKVRWLKAGKELTSGQRYKVQSKDTSSVLKIIKTQKSDGGEYVFEVSNDVGQSSCDATLTILVQFSVLFSGTPPLTTKWFKSSKEILSSADWSVIKDNTSSTLELFFAKTTDSGDYVCQIQNDVGSASCQATLFVKGY
uniref:Ig-like domain-containing protein n=1 Tax=Astatotilapia calliptera TaxID=8154 RepID=A0A3P8NZZ5_ASTCA